MSSMRPPTIAGPMPRNSREASASDGTAAPCAAAFSAGAAFGGAFSAARAAPASAIQTRIGRETGGVIAISSSSIQGSGGESGGLEQVFAGEEPPALDDVARRLQRGKVHRGVGVEHEQVGELAT